MDYKFATLEDIEVLTSSRVEVLRAANKLSDSVDMSQVEKESFEYYKKALADGSHVAILVMDGDVVVGAGGISYYTVMPTFHNPTGKKAYVMNMYTRPDYRRQGIAMKTLDLLIKDAKEKGIQEITLEATDMGKPLYEKYGFTIMKSEMELI
ncbi:MAG: GNAT family N-acetyltransferase [Pseudobutyrivibrio sp.]|nr:GNAT family N-acetyltransferase [Pseudobutyrivibrio sp.]